ncbi:Dnaj homolog subfamily c member 7 [Phtheirospermum japonicum]|uniref:Dnaj homolog subfamily c member 7 n=1 Tax=Phtheirospermum japonicum TaxID=374723 RepID=A0A830BSR2_9LAMI|nr:Dnaj homolog subfamily c member 7 [Phtheirospermum japonicum]
MSPPITTPYPDFSFPNPDCPSKSTQNFKISEIFDFSAGSSDTAGFNYSRSGNGKSSISSRSRPRLTKIRRKQMVASQDEKSVKTDLGLKLNGFSDEIKLDGKSISNGTAKNGDLNGTKERFGNGLKFGVNSNDSLFGLGLGNGKPLFGSTMNGSRRNIQSEEADFLSASNNGGSNFETGSFVFASDNKAASTANQNLPAGGSVFDRSKNGFQVDTNLESGQFVFVVDESESGPKSNFGAKDLRRFNTQPKVNGFKKSDSIPFMFGSDKYEFDSRVTLNGQDSNKSCLKPSVDEFQKGKSAEFVFGASKNNVSAENNSDTQNQDSGKNTDKSEPDLDTSGDSEKVGSHLNFVIGSYSKDSKAGIDLDKKPTCINKDMSNSTDSGKENKDDVFVFGGSKGNGSFSYVGNRGKADDCNGFGQHNHNTPDSNYRQSNKGGFSEKGFAFSLSDQMRRLNIKASEVDTKETENFTSKLAGLDSSNADCSTPNMMFAFPDYRNSFSGLGKKLDNGNSKSVGGKRLKKKTGKLKQRTVVQQLFGQDQKSPGCGSPMDFSPYQDTKAPEAEKDTYSEHSGNSHDDDENNSSFSLSFIAQDGLSAVRQQYKKKYKLRVGLNRTVQGNNSEKENGKRVDIPTSSQELCEPWRIRGNQAYHDGKLSKAEEFYSKGIDLAPRVDTPGYSMKPLLLCYSNRAATRMSLARMREAIGDCTKAAELDPSFLKVTLRAGNCYLVLGEVEDAIQCYSKCLSLEGEVCLDRRITIEAADGLQKANRVAGYMHQSTKLLQEGTDNSATTALNNIDEALSISRFSERLLQLKGEALCSLRMYDEVIKLCEQTIEVAKKNFGADANLWRCHLQAKSYFQMGQLDLALGLIEKQEKMPVSSGLGDVTRESSMALATTIRELLSLKKSGNEAFNSGRYTEAIENYTSAISKSLESRPFMAICFCNRAAAYQSVNQIVDAIADCSLSIALDENYQKAISRRATLHEMIRDYKAAVYDLQRLISLLESQSQIKSQQSDSQSKSNGGSVRDLRKARRRLSTVEEKAKREIPMDLYLILGIKASDAESEIKKAYRKAALRHHPDKVLVRSDVGDGGTLWKDFGEKIHKDADRLFKIIGEAYAVLSDPSKRSKYDNEEETRNIYKESNRNTLRTKEGIGMGDKRVQALRLKETIGGTIGMKQDLHIHGGSVVVEIKQISACDLKTYNGLSILCGDGMEKEGHCWKTCRLDR